MKIANLVLTVLFALFAAVQYNDPDPWGWIGIYGLVAVVSGFAVVGKYQRYVILAGLAVCVIWMATLVPGVAEWIGEGMPSIAGEMKTEVPYIELTREFFGLLLCTAVLVFHYVQALRRRLAGN